MPMENLYGWLFHYNIYEQTWYSFRREDMVKYFNGELLDHEVYKSKKIMDLIQFMAKHAKD